MKSGLLTVRKEHRLEMFENRVLMKVFCPKRRSDTRTETIA